VLLLIEKVNKNRYEHVVSGPHVVLTHAVVVTLDVCQEHGRHVPLFGVRRIQEGDLPGWKMRLPQWKMLCDRQVQVSAKRPSGFVEENDRLVQLAWIVTYTTANPRDIGEYLFFVVFISLELVHACRLLGGRCSFVRCV